MQTKTKIDQALALLSNIDQLRRENIFFLSDYPAPKMLTLIAEFHGEKVSNIRLLQEEINSVLLSLGEGFDSCKLELVRAGWIPVFSNGEVDLVTLRDKVDFLNKERVSRTMIEDGSFAVLSEELKDSFKYFGSNSKIRTPAEITYPGRISVGNWVSFGRYGKIVMLPTEAFGERPDAAVAQHYPELLSSFDHSPLKAERKADLFLGDGTTLGNNYFIICTQSITFGKHVMSASNLFVSDCHHIFEEMQIPPALLPVTVGRPICIEDHVWIGINCCILEGVHIGEHAVIAANSVVKEDVPPYALVAGTPAKIKKFFKPGERKSF